MSKPVLFVTQSCGQCHALLSRLVASGLDTRVEIVYADAGDAERERYNTLTKNARNVPALALPGGGTMFGWMQIAQVIARMKP